LSDDPPPAPPPASAGSTATTPRGVGGLHKQYIQKDQDENKWPGGGTKHHQVTFPHIHVICTSCTPTAFFSTRKKGENNYLFEKKKVKLFFTVFFSSANNSRFITSVRGGVGA
jgi:hypothetical protein